MQIFIILKNIGQSSYAGTRKGIIGSVSYKIKTLLPFSHVINTSFPYSTRQNNFCQVSSKNPNIKLQKCQRNKICSASGVRISGHMGKALPGLMPSYLFLMFQKSKRRIETRFSRNILTIVLFLQVRFLKYLVQVDSRKILGCITYFSLPSSSGLSHQGSFCQAPPK